jgi:flagella basal body P-ring formation protein FlgA
MAIPVAFSIFGTKFAKCVVSINNTSINQHFPSILQMLCRSEKSFKVSGIGHLKRLPRVLFGGVSGAALLALMCGLSNPAMAQTQNAASSAGQQRIDAQLKPWYAKVERVEESSVSIVALDSRLKIEACEKPINFDFPFVSHKTVRARCESPQWQYYLQVNAASAVTATNVGVSTNSGAPSSPPPSMDKVAPTQSSASANTPSAALTSPPKTTSNNPGYHTVLTSSQFLKRGTILDPSMFTGTEVAFTPGDNSALSNPKDVAHMELLRDLPANTTLKSFDLKPMVMIKKGQQVLVSIGEGKGFLITVRAESLQDGQLGEQIRLKNTESGRPISAVVTGVNTAKAI